MAEMFGHILGSPPLASVLKDMKDCALFLHGSERISGMSYKDSSFYQPFVRNSSPIFGSNHPEECEIAELCQKYREGKSRREVLSELRFGSSFFHDEEKENISQADLPDIAKSKNEGKAEESLKSEHEPTTEMEPGPDIEISQSDSNKDRKTEGLSLTTELLVELSSQEDIEPHVIEAEVSSHEIIYGSAASDIQINVHGDDHAYVPSDETNKENSLRNGISLDKSPWIVHGSTVNFGIFQVNVDEYQVKYDGEDSNCNFEIEVNDEGKSRILPGPPKIVHGSTENIGDFQINIEEFQAHDDGEGIDEGHRNNEVQENVEINIELQDISIEEIDHGNDSEVDSPESGPLTTGKK